DARSLDDDADGVHHGIDACEAWLPGGSIGVMCVVDGHVTRFARMTHAAHHLVPGSTQTVCQRAADETGSSTDEDSHEGFALPRTMRLIFAVTPSVFISASGFMRSISSA